jgi:hypothetical protein
MCARLNLINSHQRSKQDLLKVQLCHNQGAGVRPPVHAIPVSVWHCSQRVSRVGCEANHEVIKNNILEQNIPIIDKWHYAQLSQRFETIIIEIMQEMDSPQRSKTRFTED